MDSLALWIGMFTAALAAAAALWLPDRRTALTALTVAMLLAPVLIAADNWNSNQFLDLRDSPALLAAAAALGAALIAAGAAILVRHPRLLPLALIAVLPFRIPLDFGGSSANLLLPLYAVLAAGLVAAWVRPERVFAEAPSGRSRLIAAISPLLAVVVVLYTLQGAYVDDLGTAVENLCFFFIPFAALFLFLVATPWDGRLLRMVVVLLAIEGLVFALIGFGQFATGELFWNQKVIDGNEAHAYFRVNSLFFDPNIMGRYLAITMVALAAVATWGLRRDALRASAAFAVLLAALVLTFSQTSILALIAGLLALVLARWGLSRAVLASAAALAALALAVFGLGGGGLTAETTGRTGLVSGGLEIAGDRPLTGYGSGSFAAQFTSRFGAADGIAVESHTEPITVAAEQGLIGLIGYAALLLVPALGLWRSAGMGLGPARVPIVATVLAAFVAMIVHSFGYAAFLSDPITWTLLALAVALPTRRLVAATPAPGGREAAAAIAPPAGIA